MAIYTPQKSDVDIFLFLLLHAYSKSTSRIETTETFRLIGKHFFFPHGFKSPALQPTEFPAVCVCGNKHNATGFITSYCSVCQGKRSANGLHFFCHDSTSSYGLVRICTEFGIPHYYALSRYATLIYQRGYLR